MRRSTYLPLVAFGLLAACADVGSSSSSSSDEGSATGEIASADTSDSLVISEIFYNPSDPTAAESNKEWIEIFNPTGATIDLTGFTLTVASSQPSTITAANGGKIGPGQYAVLASSETAIPEAARIKGLYSTQIKLSNQGATVSLTEIARGIVVDSVPYVAGAPWPTNQHGRAIQVDAKSVGTVLNDSSQSWCGATTAFDSWTDGAGNTTAQLGTPGLANGNCASGAGGAGGAGGAAGAGGSPPLGDGFPAVGELLISEMMINPTAPAETGEWIEIHNPTTKAFDLRGLQLVSNANTFVLASPTPIVSSPGSYLVFAHSDDPTKNGGLPAPVFVYPSTIGLSDSIADGIALRVINEDGVVVRTLDEASYPGDNLSQWVGAARSLSPDNLDAAKNDQASAWCPATSTYGASVPKDRGTPGLPNDVCATGTGGAGGAGGQATAGAGGQATAGAGGQATAGAGGQATAGAGGQATAGAGGTGETGGTTAGEGGGAGEAQGGDGGTSAAAGTGGSGTAGKGGTGGSTSGKGGSSGTGGSTSSGKGGSSGTGGSTSSGKGGSGATSSGKGGSSGKAGAAGAGGSPLAVSGDDGGCSVVSPSSAGRSGQTGIALALGGLVLAGRRRSRRASLASGKRGRGCAPRARGAGPKRSKGAAPALAGNRALRSRGARVSRALR